MRARLSCGLSSFWTFSDIFEEHYFPSVPFHGGFGLMNLHGIPKPTYRAFELLHQLGTEQLLVGSLHETVDAWAIRRGHEPTIKCFDETYPEMTSKYGFKCSYNPTFSDGSRKIWISKGYYGLDQGPTVLMIENYRSGFLWRLMRRCPYIIAGLRRAGFTNCWLRARIDLWRPSS